MGGPRLIPPSPPARPKERCSRSFLFLRLTPTDPPTRLWLRPVWCPVWCPVWAAQVLEMWIITGTLLAGIIVAFLEQVGEEDAPQLWQFQLWTITGMTGFLCILLGKCSADPRRAMCCLNV